MKPKYTPGPWIVSKYRNQVRAAHGMICDTTDDGLPLIAHDANADLIASAPDLDLMLWALTHGWGVEKANSKDNTSERFWMWVPPNGHFLDCSINVENFDDRPCIDDAIRTAMMEDRNR